jgi:hypothetical protein
MAGSVSRTHLCLHQVDSLCPELTHAIEDVHHPFILSHVKHGVNGNEATSPTGSSTEREGSICVRDLEVGPAVERPLPFSPVPKGLHAAKVR